MPDPADAKDQLNLESSQTPAGIVIRCTGRITAATAPKLRDALCRFLPETERIVLDLTGVSYIDSSGLGAIVGLWVTARKAGRQLSLINLAPRIKDLFAVTKIGQVLGIHEEYREMSSGGPGSSDT